MLHVLSDVEGAGEGAHDEDEGHQRGEELFSEAGDVTDIGARVEGDEKEEHHPGPDADPQPGNIGGEMFTHYKLQILMLVKCSRSGGCDQTTSVAGRSIPTPG
jgi:hypothetical protein